LAHREMAGMYSHRISRKPIGPGCSRIILPTQPSLTGKFGPEI
jgi:hypothetical protein